jgi:protein-tyrosine-phosphatase
MQTEQFHQRLSANITGFEDISGISAVRRETLERLAMWIAEKSRVGDEARLVFICTHNSRRSHFGQIWAQTAAWAYGLRQVRTFSGGTEATAFHPNAVRALQSQGFKIFRESEGDNSAYTVSAGPQLETIRVFSKRFDDSVNPSSHFAAILTCSDADEACPFIPGAAARFSTPYDDPKISDGTETEAAVYAARSLQIANEMLYVMRHAGELLMADGAL